MPTLIHQIHRAAENVRRRYRQSRRGSVMILVIALLVLMALIGTAFITTARTDRLSSTTHTYNTQIDLLVQGTLDLTIDQISQGVLFNANGGLSFRPDGYNNWEHTSTSLYLADRYPTPTQAGTDGYWQNISASPLSNLQNWYYQFESPRSADAAWGLVLPNTQPQPAGNYPSVNAPIVRSAVTGYQPTYIAITYPNGDVRNYPALFVNGKAVMAADADGDGIADSGLFRLPVGTINGITYYAGFRAVDNSAAINASIAIKPIEQSDNFSDVQPYGLFTANGNYFPTNIDLRGATIGSNQEFLNLLYYRLVGSTTGNSFTQVNQFYGAAAIDQDPSTGTISAAADWKFSSLYENLWAQLGARIDNPGYNGFGATGGVYPKWYPLSTGDAVSMAYHFCLANPEGSPSTMDRALPSSMYTPGGTVVKRTPYQAYDTTNWFKSNFNYVSGGMPLRAMVVPRNPVSTYVPARLKSKGPYAAGAYAFGDWVATGNGVGDSRAYVSLRDGNSQMLNDPASWAPVSWGTHPMKVNANTAGFGELWTAYWQVMNRMSPPAPPIDANSPPDYRQFRSPSRNVNAQKQFQYNFPPEEIRKLRSALAAANTMDMRDIQDRSTIREIHINDAAKKEYAVKIGGCERQPFITETMVHLWSTQDQDPNHRNAFVAVELFNPSTTPMDLSAFKLAMVPHDPSAASYNFQTLGGLTGSIPPMQSIVILSTKTQQEWPNDGPTQAKLAGIGNQAELKALTSLLQVGNKELVLMRIIGDNEDLPVDALDFQGIYFPKDDGNHKDYRYHYARGNDTSKGCLWDCAYAYPDTAATKYRAKFTANSLTGDAVIKHAGWIEDTIRDADMKLMNPSPGYLGELKGRGTGAVPWTSAVGTFLGRSVPLVSTNAGQNEPDPSKPPAKFPFGGFNRDGDLMQVPFIGNYIIRAADGSGIIDFSPVTLDAVMAEDGDEDPTNNQLESIGRFAPLDNPNGTDDFQPATTNGQLLSTWRYQFALDLFDYVTVRTPQFDFFPNVPPTTLVDLPQGSGWAQKTNPVANGPVTDQNQANKGTEDGVGENGRININTANWRVLASLPMVINTDGTINTAANTTLAMGITNYRDNNDGSGKPHGPFKNIFELNKVPTFKTSVTNTGTFNPDAGNGFGYRYLANYAALNDISNLITTRSDSFTVYVVVQGWRNVGTATPELVVQRRAAYIADRSAVKPVTDTPGAARTSMGIINVPNN